MGLLGKWDNVGLKTAEDEERSRSKDYWRSLDKQKKAAQRKKDEEFGAKWREEQRQHFMEDIYGIKEETVDKDGYKSNNLPITGKISSTLANNQSIQGGGPSLVKGYGHRGNKGGYQDTRSSLRSPATPIARGGGTGGLKGANAKAGLDFLTRCQ